jgi:hypothetical protein
MRNVITRTTAMATLQRSTFFSMAVDLPAR